MKLLPIGDGPRKVVKVVLAALMLLAVTAAFFGVRECAAAAKLQLVPAVLAVNALALAVLAVLVALKGRLYCEIVCPLGIVQDLFRWVARKKVRRVCSRLPESRRQTAVRWGVFALFAAVGIAGAFGVAYCSFAWLDPYGIFGRGISLVEPDILPDFDTASSGDVIGIFWQPEEYAINTNLEFFMKNFR